MDTNKIIRYLALCLGILYAALMILLSMDSLPVSGSSEEIKGFIIQISPGLVVLIAAVYGSIRPKYGRYIFLLISIVFTLYYSSYKTIASFMGISFPLLVITMILVLASLPVRKTD